MAERVPRHLAEPARRFGLSPLQQLFLVAMLGLAAITAVTALLTRDPQVREFQVVQDGPALRILIVPSPTVAEGDDRLETRLAQAVVQQLLRLGVHDPQITVERRLELPRSAGGKLKLVIADPAARPAHADAR